jgi:hypothetical protein
MMSSGILIADHEKQTDRAMMIGIRIESES